MTNPDNAEYQILASGESMQIPDKPPTELFYNTDKPGPEIDFRDERLASPDLTLMFQIGLLQQQYPLAEIFRKMGVKGLIVYNAFRVGIVAWPGYAAAAKTAHAFLSVVDPELAEVFNNFATEEGIIQYGTRLALGLAWLPTGLSFYALLGLMGVNGSRFQYIQKKIRAATRNVDYETSKSQRTPAGIAS